MSCSLHLLLGFASPCLAIPLSCRMSHGYGSKPNGFSWPSRQPHSWVYMDVHPLLINCEEKFSLVIQDSKILKLDVKITSWRCNQTWIARGTPWLRLSFGEAPQTWPSLVLCFNESRLCSHKVVWNDLGARHSARHSKATVGLEATLIYIFARICTYI